MDANLHQRIAIQAEEIWEAAGRPPGESVMFWLEAEKIVRDEIAAEKEAAEPIPEPIWAGSDDPDATWIPHRKEGTGPIVCNNCGRVSRSFVNYSTPPWRCGTCGSTNTTPAN